MTDQHTVEMKRGWDQRAREDARWYINTLHRAQSEEEFDASGQHEVQSQVVEGLDILTGGRDPRGLRLLEIGCGIGRMTRHLAALFGEVYAVDVSGEMIQQAQTRLQDCANVRLFETSGADFALFPDQSFDVIFSAYVFQHVPSADIIRANIVDAFRVLKPGGVFKFATNGVSEMASDEKDSPKDSWTGAAFPEAMIRATGRALGAQLLGLFGEETPYCWTMLRRRMHTRPLVSRPAPRLLLCGHVDDVALTEIELCGARPYVTLALAGEFSEWDDADTLTVEIAGRALVPRYVGPPGVQVQAALPAVPAETLLQVNVRLDTGLPLGEVTVQVCCADGARSTVGALRLR